VPGLSEGRQAFWMCSASAVGPFSGNVAGVASAAARTGGGYKLHRYADPHCTWANCRARTARVCMGPASAVTSLLEQDLRRLPFDLASAGIRLRRERPATLPRRLFGIGRPKRLCAYDTTTANNSAQIPGMMSQHGARHA
jgi:hypothetical protein